MSAVQSPRGPGVHIPYDAAFPIGGPLPSWKTLSPQPATRTLSTSHGKARNMTYPPLPASLRPGLGSGDDGHLIAVRASLPMGHPYDPPRGARLVGGAGARSRCRGPAAAPGSGWLLVRRRVRNRLGARVVRHLPGDQPRRVLRRAAAGRRREPRGADRRRSGGVVGDDRDRHGHRTPVARGVRRVGVLVPEPAPAALLEGRDRIRLT